MRIFALLTLLLATAQARAGDDPVAACRTAHGGDPPAHIACLERALRGQSATAAPESVVAPEPATRPETVTPGKQAASPAPVGLGSEQVRARAQDPQAAPERQAVRIVSWAYNSDGRATFHMADGQLWRETEATPERQRLRPGREYDARIEPGKLRGYRMYVDGVRWMFKVERLK